MKVTVVTAPHTRKKKELHQLLNISIFCEWK